MKTGETYEGYWKNDMKDGRGRLIKKKEGKIIQGLWTNDILKKELGEENTPT
jgi:hypothetical protein